MTSDPCNYGEDHYTGVANCMVYVPDAANAIDSSKGSWLIYDRQGNVIMQADYCPACGKPLPLMPSGQPLPNQELEA